MSEDDRKKHQQAGQESGGPTEWAGRESGAPGYGTLRDGLKAVGATGEPFFWDRHYLPHIESHLLIQHVCIHLADSLPRALLDDLAEELRAMPPSTRTVEKGKRIMALLDAGHGSCVLRKEEHARVVQDTFLHFHGIRYTLHAWCVMPNHAHVLFQPAQGWTMSRIVASWKMFSGRKINDWKRANGLLTATCGEGLDMQRAGQESGGPAGRESGAPSLWQREYYDRYIRDEAHYRNAVDYIHENPLKAGLVERPEQWLFSSAAMAETDGSNAIGPQWTALELRDKDPL